MTDVTRTPSHAEPPKSEPEQRHAVIVGGGISGLAAAAALRQIGWRVTVLERSPQLREVGAGVSLWPNAVHALAALGLCRPLEEAPFIQQDVRLLTWRGTPLGPSIGAHQIQAEFGAPLLMVHRAALQALLIAAAGSDTLLLGTSCLGFEHNFHRASARLGDRSTVDGDILVGADGVDSIVRQAIFRHTACTYSGYTTWRGVVPVDDALKPRIAGGQFLGPASLFGIASLGGSQVYWWASRRCPESDGGRQEQEKTQLLQHWGHWADPIPDLLDATPAEAIIRTPLQALPPLHNLTLGRIVLIGDAAHPIMPDLGQGACQAIEDALELAAALKDESNLASALSRYNVRRRRRTAIAVRRARRMSRIAHLRNPVAIGLRNAVLRATSASSAIHRLGVICRR
jgi:2-polyprenyl-6-methoxyphenol hydroxylase-like FAD-dependent oxidoreductase